MDDQTPSISASSRSAEESVPAPDTALDSDTSPIPAIAPTSPSFDPSRMIGIIKRKALIKKLAAAYHAECLSYCQELLELQKNVKEPFLDTKPHDELIKEIAKPNKRAKRAR